MDEPTCRRLAATARVARLATLDADGRPNLVPIVFALDGDRILSGVDDKPKRTTNLARLENVRRDPRVTVLFDHYDESWARLWWVKARGSARVVHDVEEIVERLRAKYEQYDAHRIADAGLMIDVDTWTGWRAG